MAQSIQVGCYMVIGVLLMAVALALSIDGNNAGAVLVMGLSAAMFVIATVRENLDI